MTIDAGDNNEGSMAALDRYVAPGLRLWMLIALVSGILLIMVVIVCCFMRIRIPRTKRQIDLIAARRKMRKSILSAEHSPDEKAQPIVMNTAKQPVHQKGANRREHEDDTTESVPLVQKVPTHATTTV
uniref:Transmembrane inner ear n=1 Tax=Elaeophora elaphi TaxID=1147741 RepID=A0A0R3S055_9BILA